MFGAVGLISLLSLALLHPSAHFIEEGYLVLQVTDAAKLPVKNIGITCREGCATAISDSNGKVRLKLPPQLSSGSWVTIEIAKSVRGPYQVFLSPWDNQVNIPSFANESQNITSIIVARKGDKKILSRDESLNAIEIRAKTGPKKQD